MAVRNGFWWVQTGAVLLTIAALAWSGLRPGGDDPKAWYDCSIRLVGGVLILGVLAFAAYLQWADQ